MARDDPTIYMRIPQELKDLLDAASEENRRSMTAEVVARLLQTFVAPKGRESEPVHADGQGAITGSRVGEETLETVKRIEEQLQALGRVMAAQQRELHITSITAMPEKKLDKPASKSARSTRLKK